MASDDDSIFIDVLAKVDEGSFNEAESKLKDKLSHVGDSLRDSLSTAFDSIGDHLGGAGGPLDKLHDTLAGAFSGREWDSIGQRAGTALGQGVTDSLKDLTQGNLGNILGNFDHIGDVLGGALDKLSGRLDGLNKAAGGVGNILSGNGSGSDLNDILSGAKGLGLNVPGAVNNAQHAFNIISFLNDHPGQIEDSLSRNAPGIGTMENLLEKGPQEAGRQLSNWFTGRDASSPTRDSASDKWSSSVAGAISLEANTAIIQAGSVSLGGNMSFPGLPTGRAADSPVNSGRSTSTGIAAAGGDSGSMASLYSGSSILGKGFSTGGTIQGDSPGFDNLAGVLPSGSMVGLEGGEGVIRPEAMGRPGVADLVASLNQHYDEGTGAGGVGGDPNNPSLSAPPTQANQGSGGGSGPKQQQQLGSGSGGGVSGGGLIGAAEQAGVMAATVGGFGAGGIAAQMAVQETNLAVQKSSQIAATLAAAPFETFGLSGGMMGAPQVNPMGGWIGKLIGGQLGSQNVLPNTAGASVQPPKQPEPKPEDQQGQGESPSGPSGSKDDPMHVNVTNQPQAPQGSMTSAMSAGPGLAMS